MAFYQQSEPKALGVVLREGLDHLRQARFKLAHALGAAASMSDGQFEEEFGYPNVGQAARAEIQSGIGNFLANDSQISTETQTAAVVQLLNQFG